MDIIDKNVYDPTKYDDLSLPQAYRTVFKSGVAVDIVIQDLLKHAQYNTKYVNTDEKVMYHILGQQSIIQRIKDMLNEIEKDEAQLVASVED